jgi:hypothetical protein
LTLLVVVFSQDETSYLINLKQRGFVGSQLVYCSTYHLTPNRRTLFQPSTLAPLNITQVDQSFHCRVGANGIFRVSRFEVKAQFHTHTLLYPPYGLTAKEVSIHSSPYNRSCIPNKTVDFVRNRLRTPQQCYYYLRSFWRFSQRPSDSVSRSKTLI